MTRFKGGLFDEIYEAKKVTVYTIRTVHVAVMLDVSDWGEEVFDEEELLFAASDRWLEIVGSDRPDIVIKARTLDRVRIVVEDNNA